MNIEDWILDALIPTMVGVMSGVIGWIAGSRQRNAEVENTELQNVKDTLDIYTKMIEDLKTHQNYLETKIDNLISANKSLKSKLSAARERLDLLEKNLKK